MYPIIDMLESKGWKVSTSLNSDCSRDNDEFQVVLLLPDGSGKRVDVPARDYLPEDLLPAIGEVSQ